MNNKKVEFTIKVNLIFTIFIILLLLVGYFLVQNIQEKQLEIAVLKQNHLADSTKLVLLKKDNEELYHRYAYISNLNDSARFILKEREDKIKVLTSINIKLKEIIAQNTGIVDTVVDSSCVGLQVVFNGKNDVYSYIDSVTIDNPPYHKLVFNLNKFGINVFTTRRVSDGIFSGYVEFTPSIFNEYLKITDMQVNIDEELLKKDNENKLFKFIGTSGIYIMDKLRIGLGGAVIINEKHLCSYQKIIGNNFHNITYGYLF